MSAGDLFVGFFKHHPALLYGIAALIGTSLALAPSWSASLFSLFLLTLFLTAHDRRTAFLKAISLLLAGLGFFFLATLRYQFPELPVPVRGTASLEIASAVPKQTLFGPVWSYQGTLRRFLYEEDVIAQGLPVRLTTPRSGDHPTFLPGYRYQVQGTLKSTERGVHFSPLKSALPADGERQNILAEWRGAAKAHLGKYLKASIKDSHVAAFLNGMMTGQFDDRFLSKELSRFGLQHLMAVSGLHFSMVSALFGFFLLLWLPKKATSVLLILLTTSYFLFLGDSPSVTRAWVAATLGLASLFVQRECSGLNALGAGLLAVIAAEPLAIREIGFQFSFGITGSILLWYSSFHRWMDKGFVQRPLSAVLRMDTLDQHAYCFLHGVKQAFALSLSVNCAAVPLTLYHFHTFPLMGLLYNLFFPLLVTLSMLLLILACAGSPLFPWAAEQLHALNERYTGFLLNLASHLPPFFDGAAITSGPIHPEVIATLLFAIFILGIFCHTLTKKGDSPMICIV